MLKVYHFTSFFLKFKSSLLVEGFLLLNAASVMAILLSQLFLIYHSLYWGWLP